MLPAQFEELAPKILPPKLAAFTQEIAGASMMKRVHPLVLSAVVWHESTGNPKALSFDGGHGKGLGQIDDRYFPTLCAAYWGKTNRLIVFEPDFAILACAKLLRENLDALQQDLWPAVAAYNAGAGKVKRLLEEASQGKVKWIDMSPAERFAAANSATWQNPKDGTRYLDHVRPHFLAFQTKLNELNRRV